MSDEQHNPEEPLDEGRRALMKAAIYVAPTVLSAVVVKRAAAQASCGPTGTCPPDGAPCNPNGGGCNPDNCNPAG